MKQHFYHELLELEDLFEELEKLNMSSAEKEHLITIVHSSMHTVVLDTVMLELPKEDKEKFLHHVHGSTHRETWHFLKKRTVNIEDKIQKAVKELKKELLVDIYDMEKK